MDHDQHIETTADSRAGAAVRETRSASVERVGDAANASRADARGPGAVATRVLEARGEPARTIARYSRIASVYELWARLTESRARRRALELAAVRDGEAVLEVATGTGAQLVALARRNGSGRTVGVELADGMLRQTRRRLTAAGLDRIDLYQADARALPFADDSFDLVINGYMLDLLPNADIRVALREFRRVLRPAGRLVLSNMTVGERAWHRHWDALYARGLSLTANCRGVLATPILSELGFIDIQREYVSQLTFPTELVSARRAPLEPPPNDTADGGSAETGPG
jgi:ubiquinone/menaquinone biosynthesis C-methylase UbiE